MMAANRLVSWSAIRDDSVHYTMSRWADEMPVESEQGVSGPERRQRVVLPEAVQTASGVECSSPWGPLRRVRGRFLGTATLCVLWYVERVVPVHTRASTLPH